MDIQFSGANDRRHSRLCGWHKCIFLFALLTLSITACSAKVPLPGDGLFAKIETDQGEIWMQLEFEKTPLTVMSFVGLAEGRFAVPGSSTVKKGTPYFHGLTFHRVEPGFVIQGGDPNGNGSGGPGYQFPNEIHSDLRHDRAGILSMANAGPDTNGSQFFITLDAAPFLDSNYSVFGHVVKGMEVVRNIEKGDVINKLNILRQGAAAEAFQPDWEEFQELSQSISDQLAAQSEQLAQQGRSSLLDFARENWPELDSGDQSLERSDNGLEFAILQAGSGRSGSEWGDVKQYRLHYSLWVPTENGNVNKVDSSIDRGEPIELAPHQVIRGWALTMPQMRLGERRVLLIPGELGYGRRGSPPVILPDSYLLFEMELLDFLR